MQHCSPLARLTDGEVAEVRFATLRSLTWCRNDDFRLYQSDGGFEYRRRFLSESQAIRQILAELPDGTPVAYPRLMKTTSLFSGKGTCAIACP